MVRRQQRMPRKSLDLLLVFTLAVAVVALAFVGDFPGLGVLRVIVGIPMVFVAPGYALLAACWPTKDLAPAERALGTIGISLALAALDGLVLTGLGLGLRTVPWSVLLAGTT